MPTQRQAGRRTPKRADWLPNRMFDPVNNPFAIQNLLAREQEKEDIAFLPDADGRPEASYAGDVLLRDTVALPPKSFRPESLLEEMASFDTSFQPEYDDDEDDGGKPDIVFSTAENDHDDSVHASSNAAQEPPAPAVAELADVASNADTAQKSSVLAMTEATQAAEISEAPDLPDAPQAADAIEASDHVDPAVGAETPDAAEVAADLKDTEEQIAAEAAPEATTADDVAGEASSQPTQSTATQTDEAHIADTDADQHEGIAAETTSDANPVAASAVSSEELSDELGADASGPTLAESESQPESDRGSSSAEFTNDTATESVVEPAAETVTEPSAAEVAASADQSSNGLSDDAVQSLLEAAREEAREQGRQEAREAAFQEGMRAGISQTRAELQQRFDERLAELNQIVESLQRLSQDPDTLFEPMKKLAVHLAEQLVRGELTQSAQTISRLVDNCLRELAASGEKAVIVHLHPEDLEQYKPLISSFGDSIVVRPDSLLSRGSVRASLDGSVVEDLIERRVKGVQKSLSQPVAAGWRPAMANPVVQRKQPEPPKTAAKVASTQSATEDSDEVLGDELTPGDDQATQDGEVSVAARGTAADTVTDTETAADETSGTELHSDAGTSPLP